MNEIDLRVRVLLTMQVVLLGFVSVNCRAVLCAWREGEIDVRIIFDQEVSEGDQECVSEIESELFAHFSDWSVNVLYERLAVSALIEKKQDEFFVFKRRELDV
ncbi:hypothetical protein [Chromobacterium vaccinii]|uniref:hypothetical protein n=1 Tax=Chromobacterium vaccinii TaxID=1108595 RepID=UPI0011C07545|nr:hypothetical protein [Chromobacterium vaccinii]